MKTGTLAIVVVRSVLWRDIRDKQSFQGLGDYASFLAVIEEGAIVVVVEKVVGRYATYCWCLTHFGIGYIEATRLEKLE